MSIIRYPAKFWDDVRDYWEANAKASLADAVRNACEAWEFENQPNASTVTRRKKLEMWKKYGKNSTRINAKALKSAINKGRKSMTAIDKEIAVKKQKDKQKTCNGNAKVAQTAKKTEKEPKLTQDLQSKNNSNQEDTGTENEVPAMQDLRFNEDGSIDGDHLNDEDSETDKKLYLRKKVVMKKLNTALVIAETRRINFAVHEYTCQNLEALEVIREDIINAKDEEQLDLNNAKLRMILNIISATETLQKTVESNAKVSAVYWGLNTDDLKDVAEINHKRNAMIDAKKENLNKAKIEMQEQKKLAFQRELEIIQSGDDVH
ncbi:MAG: hypothetical protein [Bacteriophage sp.]|nr:MAG: hypothetical protein [Bacteriophage sp.]